jgi:acetyl-CoA C-acetyltransferase
VKEMNREVAIVSAVRTPIGKFQGSLSHIGAVELGSIVVKEVLNRANVSPDQVDEVIMGNVLQAGLGQNPARQVWLKNEFPVSVPAMTINKVCGSGLKSVILGAQEIMLGEADVVVAGGTENMTQAPHILDKARSGYRLGDGKLVDTLISDGLWCSFSDSHMGITAENIAEKYGISREEQDQYALSSQQKAAEAVNSNRFSDEIIPIELKSKKGTKVFEVDEFVRHDVQLDGLNQLKPVFKKDGTVTAGNASGINDGAAAVLLMSNDKAKQLGLEPLGTIVASASYGVDPSIMGVGPVYATKKALDKVGLTVADIDLFEVNEAFASQTLATIQELDLPKDKVNVNGGAIALGHPIGASGTRILVTCLHEMKRRDLRRGLITLCIGGGQGIALIIERNVTTF